MQQLWFNFTAYPHWQNMPENLRWVRLTAAEREFMATKPNPPGHAEFMARPAKRYPGLPGGAANAALYALETFGAKAAARYAANTCARALAEAGFCFRHAGALDSRYLQARSPRASRTVRPL